MSRTAFAGTAIFLILLVVSSAVSAQTAGTPCTLSVSVSASKTQVAKDEKATLTATVSNSGDEVCTGTILSSTASPSAGATVTWAKVSLDVPAKGSAGITGNFSASTSGSYTVTVSAARGSATASGSATIAVAAASPTPAVGTGTLCKLSVTVTSDKTTVDRDETARLTATVRNSGDEECTYTSLVPLVTSSAALALESTVVTVPGQGSATVKGTFSAVSPGLYTVTVAASRGSGATQQKASGNVAITVRAASTPTPTPAPATPSGCDGQPQGARRCFGNFAQQCSADNVWRSAEECPYGCDSGACKSPPPSTPASVNINASGLPKSTPGFEALVAMMTLGVLGLALGRRDRHG